MLNRFLKKRRFSISLVKVFFGKGGWLDVIVISKYCKVSNNHLLYEFMLKGYVDITHIKKNKRHFISDGSGENSSNVYRKVITSKGAAFEKVLLTDSVDVKSVDFFYENYQEISKAIHPFITPPITHYKKSNTITVIWYEFCDIIDEEIKKNNVINLIKNILPLTNKLKELKVNILDNQVIREGVCVLREIIDRELRLNVNEIVSDTLGRVERVFAHGDINENNLKSGNIVLDWDRCGYLPKGYDYAYYIINDDTSCIYRVEGEYEKAKYIYEDKSPEFKSAFYMLMVLFYLRKQKVKKRVIDKVLVVKIIDKIILSN